MGLNVGDSILDICIPDENGEFFKLNKFTGKRALIVYFYPKNFTLGWVKEAIDFQDKYEDFIAQNAKVFGISSNFEFSQKN